MFITNKYTVNLNQNPDGSLIEVTTTADGDPNTGVQAGGGFADIVSELTIADYTFPRVAAGAAGSVQNQPAVCMSSNVTCNYYRIIMPGTWPTVNGGDANHVILLSNDILHISGFETVLDVRLCGVRYNDTGNTVPLDQNDPIIWEYSDSLKRLSLCIKAAAQANLLNTVVIMAISFTRKE